MKRFILAMFLLAAGAALGGGGLYLGLNWNRYNPWRSKDDLTIPLLAHLRRACATDKALKGAFIKSADLADGKLSLRGLVASKEQIALIEAKVHAYLDETPDMQTQINAGVSTNVNILHLPDQLGQWQRDFDEGKGADKAPLLREVMRLTRLDDAGFAEDGTLVIKGICIRGTTNTEPTTAALKEILKHQLEATGIPKELLPELSVAVRNVANPAVALQKKLADDPANQGVLLLAARYDVKGNLLIEGLVARAEQGKAVEEAVAGLANDPQFAAAVKSPTTTEPALRLVPFDGASAPRDLQKKLAEYARKENKPHLHSVRISSVEPAPTAADAAGNPHYAFRVLGKGLDSAGDGKKTDSDLIAWLAEVLPRVHNADLTPMAAKTELAARANPIFPLQERIVQRGLDGAAITGAAYDEEGKLELVGRLHQPGDESKQTLEAALKDLLADDAPWTLALKPHEASKDGLPIAWTDVVRTCQANLAADRAVGQRTRLDRLYFRYGHEKLELAGEGVFLTDAAAENGDPAVALAKSVDGVIVSRNVIPVAAAFKRIANPLIDLQDLTTQRADLDGVLFTSARYGPDGLLYLDGFLGQPGHKASLAPLVADKLQRSADLLKKTADPKAPPAWAIDGMRSHPSAKGEWKWSEIVGACRAEAEMCSPRICVERVFFQYAEAKPRRLTLQVKAIALTRPSEQIDEPALTQKLDALGKRLLARAGVEQTNVELRKTESPIFALQKQAETDRLDGLLFQDAVYDADGKLVLTGIRGSDEQLKSIQAMLAKAVADKPFAPHGVASLDRMRLVPWQPLLTSARAQFAVDATPLLKQTRIDRVYFQHDEAGKKTIVHIDGVCIYQGKTLDADAQTAALLDRLAKHLQAQGVEGFAVNIAGIERKKNPALELQRQAIESGLDGVLFQSLSFDAKGACYVKTLTPKGQEEAVRKLLEEAAKKHPYLGAIQQR